MLREIYRATGKIRKVLPELADFEDEIYGHSAHNCVFAPFPMNLPQWVQKEIELLPAEFTGQIVIVGWAGGVSRIETKTIRTAPKVGEVKD